jgi:hypothetical protein
MEETMPLTFDEYHKEMGRGVPVPKNGASIFCTSFVETNGFWLVLCEWKSSLHPWVVWWMDKHGNCECGHYFMDRADAINKFYEILGV